LREAGEVEGATLPVSSELAYHESGRANIGGPPYNARQYLGTRSFRVNGQTEHRQGL
jgi:hypothetical protein